MRVTTPKPLLGQRLAIGVAPGAVQTDRGQLQHPARSTRLGHQMFAAGLVQAVDVLRQQVTV